MTAAIETLGLTKAYGAIRAVDDLNLRVAAGEVFGYLGPNGAGKTTTIRMLLALQRSTAGHAKVLGLDTRHDPVAICSRVGYLPGELALYPRMTGRQHIDWFAHARRQHHTSLADQLIERFQVVIDRPAKELSSGNRQKIGLVLAFMHLPDLLILDEPTAGLDPLMQNEFEQLVRETVAEGRTVFLSSHELDEVQRLADRVGIIKEGQLIATDTVEHLRQTAPQRIEVRFAHPVDRALLQGLPGVAVTACVDSQIALDVTGPIGPLLKVIADHDPIELASRHADLEELFLTFYRDTPQARGER